MQTVCSTIRADASTQTSTYTDAATCAAIAAPEYVSSALVIENIAPAPAVTYAVPSQQLHPVHTTATCAAEVNLDITGLVNPQFPNIDVEFSAPQAVSSFLPLEEFDAPVYNQIHQEQIVVGEMTQNIIANPALQEQVVDSLPLLEEFTELVYNQVHHEQFAAGDN